LEWSISRGERESGQIEVRTLFDVLGGWMLVLAETFCASLNYEIPSWKPFAEIVFVGGSDESGSVKVLCMLY
jgi:hypothetical protein